MKSRDYWKKRSEVVASRQFKKTDDYILSLHLEYQEALNSIQKDIEVFYARFSQNNEISLGEARKLLNSNQLNEFKMDLKEFTRKAKNNKNQQWEKELNNVSYKVRVTRLQALQTQIRSAIEDLYTKQKDDTTDLLSGIYEDTYYRNIFEVHKGLGIGVNFAKLDTNIINKVITEPWHGDNYSSRIWKNKEKLIMELQTNLAQAFIRGDSIDKTSKIIADRMEVSRNRARTLVNTESANIVSKATFNSYAGSGVVKKYQILATLDSRTSEICRSMDAASKKEPFDLNKWEVGVTAPPFHANCRSTTIAYFDDAIDEERIARDNQGKAYYVDGNMSYEQWYNKYVKGNSKEEIAEKKIQNRVSDNQQYLKYKEILGNLTPKSFADFQDLKYNDVNKWNELQYLYKDVNWQLKSQNKLTNDSVHKVPFIGEPNSVFDNYKDGVLDSRRYYGRTGKPRLDIHFTNHGNSKLHPIVPHSHDWNLKDEDIVVRDKNLRELSKAEKIANKSVCKKVK
ncbi:minor capsid protein [Clostridium rectalis]|uniref:minor capsid protein n=1 Tax=Clostridium rectalis TaxID=2040295 RepID=UPI001FA9B45E|nr:minor capsid protein [Clostridium rectalis]